MKLLILFLAVLGLQLMVVPAPIALADSGLTPAEATAHALDELANLCAQRRPECPPTVTPTPTWTPSPTSTSTLRPTDTPPPSPTPSPTPTTEPCWVTDQVLGDPDNGHIVFDDLGAPIPCSTDDPTPAATDTPTPTSTPTVTSSATPVVVYVQQPAPAAPAPQVQERIVVQTVVVTTAAIPATPSSATTLPPRLALASTPAPVPASTQAPTATASEAATATATRTPVPPAAAATSSSSDARQVGRWDWGGFLEGVGIAAVVIVAAIWLLTRRKVVVWGARHKPERESADA